MVKRPLDQLREVLRLKHYSYRTKAYVDWMRRFILFHGKRHPQEMGAPKAQASLAHLVQDRNISASTQNQALIASSSFSFIARSFTKKSSWPSPAPNGRNVYPPCSPAKSSSVF